MAGLPFRPRRDTSIAMLRAALSIACPVLLFAAPLRAEIKWEQPFQNFHRTPGDARLETKFVFQNAGKAPAADQPRSYTIHARIK